jgi:outer membrane protein OmpA-like peptidoglycan-associated protein/tetratricopeptide (TPR) repeat protein
MKARIHPQHPRFTAMARQLLRMICLLLIMQVSFTHALEAQRADKWYDKGAAAFNAHEYTQALEYLQWSIDHGGDWKSKLLMANCWGRLMNYAKAEALYAQIIDEPSLPPATYFRYAQALMTAKKYDEAEQWFARYAAATVGDPNATQFKNLDKLVASVKSDSMEFVVERMSINSSSSDFAPYIYRNGIAFVSGRPNDLAIKHISTLDNAQLLDLYFSAPDSNGRWSRPRLMTELNSKLNEGPIAIDTVGHHLYLTRNDLAHKDHQPVAERSSLNKLRIEQLDWQDGKWAFARSLSFNNIAYAVGHPALSADGKTMYFASDAPGGLGGTDLYSTELVDGNWTTPTNLGNGINTTEDEMFPHLDAQGQLYFASNGHLGLGGLDLFYVQPMANGAWSRVQNLGFPINSERDDFAIVTDRGGSHGFFSSNRGQDADNDDIYSFLRDWPSFECAPMLKNNYCFSYEDEGFLDIDTLPFVYEWSFGDGQKARGEQARHCYAGPGEYHIEFNIIDTTLGVVFMTPSEYVLIISDTEQVTIDVPDTVAIDQEIELNATQSVLQGCDIAHYYWETGDGTRGRGITFPHAYTAVGRYEIKLGVTGLPAEDGSLACKNCVTKQIVIVTPAELEKIEVHRAEINQKANEPLRAWPIPDDLKPIQDEASKAQDNPQGTHYTVELQHNLDPIDPEKAPFAGLKDLREVRTQDGYTVYQGLEDSIQGIYPYFTQAKKLGFEEAIVILTSDTKSATAVQPKVVKIPLRKDDRGVTLFLGELKDAAGNPIQALVTWVDFENSKIVYQQRADAQGRVQMELPDGRIFTWTAEVGDYVPVSGFLDLTYPQGMPKTDAKHQKSITLNLIQDLAESGEAIVINNILFDFDSDRLRTESFETIAHIARFLIEHPDIGIEVLAHTDNAGNDAYNLDLSRRRAFAVLTYMISVGYDVSHIRSQGYGESKPIVPNDTPEHRQLNRRVEFQFYPVSPASGGQ